MNVLFFHWHDLGRHLASYGRRSVRTPHLDALAAQGTLFERAFCTTPLCSPARGSMMTGRFPFRNGLMGLAHQGWRLHEDELTLPMLFGAAGYATALFGVQHETTRPGGQRLGFQTAWEHDKLAEPVTDAFIHWLRHDRPTGRPWFAGVGFYEPHRPHVAGRFEPGRESAVEILPYLPDTPGIRRDLAGYEALVEHADRQAGRLLTALDELGLGDETLVVFTTDHGTEMPRAKSSLYDPGLETALILRLPGAVPAGRRESALVSTMDLFPTLLEAAGIPLPADRPLDGVSLWPLVTANAPPPRVELFATYSWVAAFDLPRCLRTSRHKLIHNTVPGRPVFPAPEFVQTVGAEVVERYFSAPRPEWEFYDLEADPGERHNLADDPAHAALAAELRTRLYAFRCEAGDPILLGEHTQPQRPAGIWPWRATPDGWRLRPG